MDEIERRVADARAEGYADGYTQARQRAESRVALGLPLVGEGDLMEMDPLVRHFMDTMQEDA